jgi:hypothetical protein
MSIQTADKLAIGFFAAAAIISLLTANFLMTTIWGANAAFQFYLMRSRQAN